MQQLVVWVRKVIVSLYRPAALQHVLQQPTHLCPVVMLTNSPLLW